MCLRDFVLRDFEIEPKFESIEIRFTVLMLKLFFDVMIFIIISIKVAKVA